MRKRTTASLDWVIRSSDSGASTDVLDPQHTFIREMGTFAGPRFEVLSDSSIHPFYPMVKRVMDVCIAVAVLTVGMPLWVFIALMIKLETRGPVFYVEERAGLNGRPFRMYKFRSMIDGADALLDEMVGLDTLPEPVFNIRKDPRVTRMGKILRRTSLDEVPQFANVLMGSMSVVGPRPERVELVRKYNAYQRRRLTVRPGITGHQQVISRGDPSLSRRIELDIHYLKHQSFLLDAFILLKTLPVIIRGDGLT